MQAASLVVVAALTCGLVAGVTQARAKTSSDQIITSLDPRGRGIRPVAPAPEPPPSLATAPSAHATATPANRSNVPTAPVAAPSVNLTVQFRTNSADLTPAAIQQLNELGRALSSPALATYRFRIEGHTDTVGSPEENKALSERRAATVVAYLGTKFNVDRGRLEAAGMGEEGLLVQTPPQTSEPRNRRVQVINLGA